MTRSELDELRTYLDRRFDAVDGRLDLAERQHTDLVEFLGRKFDKIDTRFDGVEGRLDGVEGRLEGVEGRLDGVEGRLDGVEGRLEGVEGRLEGVEGRLEGVEQRLAKVEVGQEGIRDDIQLLAEGFGATTRRIDRLEALHRDELA